jgi:hypothetical protein
MGVPLEQWLVGSGWWTVVSEEKELLSSLKIPLHLPNFAVQAPDLQRRLIFCASASLRLCVKELKRILIWAEEVGMGGDPGGGAV